MNVNNTLMIDKCGIEIISHLNCHITKRMDNALEHRVERKYFYEKGCHFVVLSAFICGNTDSLTRYLVGGTYDTS